jgi:enoyl-CoA hydratase/carnithine racemase
MKPSGDVLWKRVPLDPRCLGPDDIAEARMLYNSQHVRVEAADGVATLWLEFPGLPVNALMPSRLAEVDRGLSAALSNRHLDVLVIRSGKPAGFCGGHGTSPLDSDSDRATFAVAGQQVLIRISAADILTVAFLEGPCLGPGLELALACDHRLAVSGPDAWLGFPDAARGLPPCWGGEVRLKRLLGRRARPLLQGELVTAREAWGLGLVDDAFCGRRATVELRRFLDRLLAKPRKRPALDFSEELAAERAAFRLGSPTSAPGPSSGAVPVPHFEDVVAVAGDTPAAARLAVEIALRGGQVVARDGDWSLPLFAEAVRRGRVTPLEAEQARQRIRPDGDARFVFAFSPAGVRIVRPIAPPGGVVEWVRSLGIDVLADEASPAVPAIRHAA